MKFLLSLLFLFFPFITSAQTIFTWGDIDTRYSCDTIPQQLKRTLKLKAWRGERVSAQALFYNASDSSTISITHTPLRCGKSIIADSLVNTNIVRYVWTDELNKERTSGCGLRPNKADWDSTFIADRLEPLTTPSFSATTPTTSLWFTVNIPADAPAGHYTMTIEAQPTPNSLTLSIEVLDRTLPPASDWNFHLDLWQNPYAVARYHNVPLWSKEHFDAMRPLFRMLAGIGQRSITTSIMHHPWNAQTYDPYDSMIGRTRKIDGTWQYDYTVFDRYVTFMQDEVGITGMISCYTMIPWALSFDYYDQATSRIQFIKARPGEQAYTDYWLPFLRDFAQHLKAKGWFDKTAISMDERPMELMREAINLIRQADPDFKITLAGGYHPEIVDDLHYLSIPYGYRFPEDVKARREQNGQISTVYTCCVETFPNSFTFSSPAESAWTVLHALAAGYDGWLRWAVNSWTEDPLNDSRFWSWAAGDTYSIYPGPCSSIRFERLVQGLQDCEKIHQLRKTLTGARLKQLEDALAAFDTTKDCNADQRRIVNPTPAEAAQQVNKLHDMLNRK